MATCPFTLKRHFRHLQSNWESIPKQSRVSRQLIGQEPVVFLDFRKGPQSMQLSFPLCPFESCCRRLRRLLTVIDAWTVHPTAAALPLPPPLPPAAHISGAAAAVAVRLLTFVKMNRPPWLDPSLPPSLYPTSHPSLHLCNAIPYRRIRIVLISAGSLPKNQGIVTNWESILY